MTTNHDSLDYQVGQKVKYWRLKRGYTQEALAEKIGTTRQIVSQYEKGTRRISIEKLYAIVEALSVSIKDLIPIPKDYLANEGEEISNLMKEYKTINDQELRKVFYLLTKSTQLSEKNSRKAERIEIAKNLTKAGISVDVISKIVGLSVDEYTKKKSGFSFYKIGAKIKEWRLKRKYTQEDLAKKIGVTRHKISKYEQGKTTIPLYTLYDIAEALSISIIDLLPELTEDDKVENELPSIIEEYKKIESQELRHALIKSLSKGIRIYEKKIRKAERIKVAKDLVKEGISIDTILQTIGVSFGEIQ
ncbi:WO male-killing family protein Wmk [Wolbachia endosymbiont of Ctenocephalides felis wCfeJ]|uniref:WO male-killing family protein Wmk n=1 Tax=Wolbachia endosymbiont of Ctenocephalides felis wCfeJ TaxID=2732594 RepID=UPI0014481B1B|nr:helix-turn-helix domain-containing protein [Wolbachia endosymbiont of Ctenocephalides felis wCfeJ]WCR58427.1 MAG: hypothetical protein PG980_000899 [Wolbachia endosymbiont of Ctenocephalides felis wCfeJ]